ncbi:MAG TPA: hypothetical protein VGI74_18685 [Streptosporangiaceae bacterium]
MTAGDPGQLTADHLHRAAGYWADSGTLRKLPRVVVFCYSDEVRLPTSPVRPPSRPPTPPPWLPVLCPPPVGVLVPLPPGARGVDDTDGWGEGADSGAEPRLVPPPAVLAADGTAADALASPVAGWVACRADGACAGLRCLPAYPAWYGADPTVPAIVTVDGAWAGIALAGGVAAGAKKAKPSMPALTPAPTTVAVSAIAPVWFLAASHIR